MKRLFDYNCSACSITFEELADLNQPVPCPKCNSVASRMISAPTIKLEGWTGSFPGAADAWARKHEKQSALEAKRNAE